MGFRGICSRFFFWGCISACRFLYLDGMFSWGGFDIGGLGSVNEVNVLLCGEVEDEVEACAVNIDCVVLVSCRIRNVCHK